MVVALGMAFRNQPVEKFHVVIPQSKSAGDLKSSLDNDERFDVEILDESQCRRLLRVGQADLLVIPGSSEGPDQQYHFDPTKSSSVLARNAVDDALQRATGRKDVFRVEDVEVSEPGGRYIDFLVPGLIGMGLMGGGMWGVGFAVVDLRIRKLLKRYLATPMRRSHFLGALMISRLIFMIPEIVILLVFARLVFGVTVHGNYLTLTLFILIGAFQFAGIGLLVASRAKTLETVSGLMNLVMMPMWIASGIFFSTERFPDVLQPLIKFFPLTPLIDAIRSVMLEGTGILSLGPELGMTTAWTVVTFVLALKFFRWN
jgi:ABC-type multidrug transport system permease subunit